MQYERYLCRKRKVGSGGKPSEAAQKETGYQKKNALVRWNTLTKFIAAAISTTMQPHVCIYRHTQTGKLGKMSATSYGGQKRQKSSNTHPKRGTNLATNTTNYKVGTMACRTMRNLRGKAKWSPPRDFGENVSSVSLCGWCCAQRETSSLPFTLLCTLPHSTYAFAITSKYRLRSNCLRVSL